MELIDYILSSPSFEFFVLMAKIFGPLFFLFFLGIIILCFKKSQFLQKAFLADLVELGMQKAYGMGKMEKRWAQVLKRLGSSNPPDWKLAIIEAENITEEVLSRMGFGGESFGDKLKKVTKERLQSLDELQEAHQIRNNIIHDPDYRLDVGEATRIAGIYGKCLKELEAL